MEKTAESSDIIILTPDPCLGTGHRRDVPVGFNYNDASSWQIGNRWAWASKEAQCPWWSSAFLWSRYQGYDRCRQNNIAKPWQERPTPSRDDPMDLDIVHKWKTSAFDNVAGRVIPSMESCQSLSVSPSSVSVPEALDTSSTGLPSLASSPHSASFLPPNIPFSKVP